MKQSELIQQLSPKQLRQSLVYTQLIFIVVAMAASIFIFDSMTNWLKYIKLIPSEIFYYGVLPGLIIVGIDFILMTFVPKKYQDDGGLNEKIFTDLSIGGIFWITLLIAISEELLFRGVLQTTFGYMTASTIFALVHFRYLRKPVLLISVLFVSFYIGYLFLLTNNLVVTITTHFTIDFLLGLWILYTKRGVVNVG